MYALKDKHTDPDDNMPSPISAIQFSVLRNHDNFTLFLMPASVFLSLKQQLLHEATGYPFPFLHIMNVKFFPPITVYGNTS